MGDIAEGLIDGTFDSITGEYLGEGHGYPRSIHWDKPKGRNSSVNGVKQYLSKNQIYNSLQHEYCLTYIRQKTGEEYKGGMSWKKLAEIIQGDWGAFVKYVKNTPLSSGG